MRRCKVITEGQSDVLLLQAILAVEPDKSDVVFIAAGGWSSADSLARSVLIHGDADVALVVGADARDPNHAEERRQFLEQSLGSIPSEAQYQVFVIVPEIEVLLFEDRSILESLVGRTISDTDWIRGQFEPKKVLEELLNGSNLVDVFPERLAKIDLKPLKALSPLSDLASFVSHGSDIVMASN